MEQQLRVENNIGETNLAAFVLAGRFDAHESERVRAVLLEPLEAGHVDGSVDLADVSFLDSSALAVLTTVMKRCREAGGDLTLVSVSDPVRVILELTRLDLAFTIVE